MRTSSLPGPPLLGLLLAACAAPAPRDGAPDAGRAPARAAPMDLDGAAASNWEYVRRKYDRDGDGRVSAAEYDRDPERFRLLDHDADGTLSDADFPAFDAGSMGAWVRRRRALRTLAAYFQADERDQEIRLDEVEWMATSYDADGDGAIEREEFVRAADEHRREVVIPDPSGTERVMLGTFTPWEALVAAADPDGDGRLTPSELAAFFQSGSGGEEVWPLVEADEPEEPSGVAVGEPAPDFRLEPPDGGERVSLSGFRGKPVALIFGSYT